MRTQAIAHACLDHAELLLPCINQGIDGKRSRARAATSLIASEGTRDEAAGGQSCQCTPA